MLIVKTKIGQSMIEGVGLFADQFIPKGTIIWKYDPRFDIYFTKDEVEKMPSLQKKLLIHSAYLSKKSGNYVYSIDNTRFTNHSIDANTAENFELHDELEIPTIATRDIVIGEELTIDYHLIDKADEISDEEYLH